ncbi:helix-turn-helix domain-containing protein [Phytohabitans kaempferiae]|uniref:Helix-turn-helix domain-containing protein n=1 Tax=Phytohabitans kaempferiae TaxID=1620943 RepID=A0ABV6M970_9ACTN
MSKYVITITPDNDGAAGADTAHTTVHVDISTGQTRITELTVRAASGGGLAPADLPPVDLDLLVRALAAPTPPPALPAAAEPVEEVEAVPTARRRPRKTAAKKAAAKATKTTGRRAAKEAAEGGGTRAYRRMPEADQVMDVYRQTGSITAVAEHFGVPRHTVAGWARRLRQQGHAIGRQ